MKVKYRVGRDPHVSKRGRRKHGDRWVFKVYVGRNIVEEGTRGTRSEAVDEAKKFREKYEKREKRRKK